MATKETLTAALQQKEVEWATRDTEAKQLLAAREAEFAAKEKEWALKVVTDSAGLRSSNSSKGSAGVRPPNGSVISDMGSPSSPAEGKRHTTVLKQSSTVPEKAASSARAWTRARTTTELCLSVEL